MTRSRLLIFGGNELGAWADPIFAALPAGPAVLLSFGVEEYGPGLVEKLRGAGLARLERVGREARALTGSTRAEYDASASVAALDGAGFVYVQGGNPKRLVEVLRDSRFWATALAKRLPIVTTSGSSMALGACCPDFVPGRFSWLDGFSLVPDALIAPHWDSLHQRDPNFRAGFEAEAGARTLYALDDDSLLELDGDALRTAGPGAVQRRVNGAWEPLSRAT